LVTGTAKTEGPKKVRAPGEERNKRAPRPAYSAKIGGSNSVARGERKLAARAAYGEGPHVQRYEVNPAAKVSRKMYTGLDSSKGVAVFRELSERRLPAQAKAEEDDRSQGRARGGGG